MLPFLFSSQYCDRAANHLDERTSSAESDKAQGNILRKMSVRYSSFASKIGCFLCYQSIWFKIDQTVFFMSLFALHCKTTFPLSLHAWNFLFCILYWDPHWRCRLRMVTSQISAATFHGERPQRRHGCCIWRSIKRHYKQVALGRIGFSAHWCDGVRVRYSSVRSTKRDWGINGHSPSFSILHGFALAHF